MGVGVVPWEGGGCLRVRPFLLPERFRGLVLLTAAALLWSSAGLFIKLLPLGGFQIAACRSLIAALTITVVLRLRGAAWTVDLDPMSLACSLSYALVLILFVLATQLTTAANAIFLQYAAPIYLLFLEPWAFHRPFPRRPFPPSLAGRGETGEPAMFKGARARERLFWFWATCSGPAGSAISTPLWRKSTRSKRPRTPASTRRPRPNGWTTFPTSRISISII